MKRTRSVAVALALTVLALFVGAIVCTAPLASPTTGGASAPLTTAINQGGDTWLVVPMGRVGHPLNTFWELFFRSPAANRWVTVTPPGVADNGGLVITTQPGNGLLAGFLTSQDLTFSPLSVSTDGGRNWSAVYFPTSLISYPTVLAGSPSGATVALGRAGHGTAFEAAPGLKSWAPVATVGRVRAGTAGARCGVTRLTAAAIAPDAVPVVGAACDHRGVLGLFRIVGGRARAMPAVIPSSMGTSTFTVLSLVASATGIEVLVAARNQQGGLTLAAGRSSAPGATLTLSAPLAVGSGAKILATGTTPSDGLFVLIKRATGGPPQLASITPGTGSPRWDVLPDLPTGTVAAAFSPGRIDAMTVHSSTLIDYEFDQASTTWVQSQVVHVDIQYGSSI